MTTILRRHRSWHAATAALAMALCWTGCTDGTGAEPVAATPQLVALSTYEAALGTSVDVFDEDAPAAPEGTLTPFADLVFTGVFVQPDGTSTAADAREALIRDEIGVLRWDTLGPYTHPFSRERTIGVFQGDAHIEYFEHLPSGERGELLGATGPSELEFTVAPSVFITDFRPVDAACAGPVRAALAGLPYQIAAEAVGFEAEAFQFSLEARFPEFDDARSIGAPAATVIDVPATNNNAEAGETAAFRAPMTPTVPASNDGGLARPEAQASSYALTVRAAARGRDGRDYETSFTLFAFNPFVVYDVGEPRLAQTYAPIAVSQCISAGLGVTTVSYTDSVSETRTRSVSSSASSSYGESLARGETQAVGETRSESNSYSVSETDTQSDTYTGSVKMTAEVEVSTGLLGFGAKTTYGIELGFSYARSNTHARSTSESASQGFGTSRTSTDSVTTGRSQNRAYSESIAEAQSSTILNSQGISQPLFPGTAGVWYRQLSRYEQEAVVVRYSLCGEEQIIGRASFPDYRWSVEFAAGPSCTPAPPPSDLRAAQCFVPPCD